jgi:hypothetical protein
MKSNSSSRLWKKVLPFWFLLNAGNSELIIRLVGRK